MAKNTQNSVCWFVGIETLKLGVTDTVISFNEGYKAKANLIERLGISLADL